MADTTIGWEGSGALRAYTDPAAHSAEAITTTTTAPLCTSPPGPPTSTPMPAVPSSSAATRVAGIRVRVTSALISTIHTGTVATTSAASPESRCCSPALSSPFPPTASGRRR